MIAYWAEPSPSDADDRPVGLRELDADRGGEPEAEPAAGAEVVAAGPREPQLVAQRERADGASSTTMPSSGRPRASAVHDRGRRDRVASSSPAVGSGSGSRRARAVDSAERGEQRLERELDVGDDRVAHRRARRLVGVARDRDELGALGKQRAGDVRVVGEDRGADDEHEVVAGERLGDRADRRRQDAVEVRVALGEADPPAAGRRDAQTGSRAALGERDGGVPGAGRVDVGPGDEHRVRRAGEPPGERRDARPRRGARAPLTERAIACATRRRRPPRPSRPSGSRRTPGPRGGSAARWIARASACGTSSARGGS